MPSTARAGSSMTSGPLRRVATLSARHPLETIAFSVLLSVTAYLALVHYFAKSSFDRGDDGLLVDSTSAGIAYAEGSRLLLSRGDGPTEVIPTSNGVGDGGKEALLVTVATSDEGYTEVISRILATRVAAEDSLGQVVTYDRICVTINGQCVTFGSRSDDAGDDASRSAYSWLLDISTPDQFVTAMSWQANLLSTFVPGMKARTTTRAVTTRRSQLPMADGFLDLKQAWEKSENVDIFVVVVGWVLLHGTIFSMFLKQRQMGSRFTLGFAVLISCSCALNIALLVARMLGASFSLGQLSEALPFFTVAVSFDRHVELTRSIINYGSGDASRRPSVREKVVGGVEEAGAKIVKEYAAMALFLICGAFSGIAGLNDFCLLACFIVTFDAILLFTLYSAVVTLKLELNRIRETQGPILDGGDDASRNLDGPMSSFSSFLLSEFSVGNWRESPLMGKVKLLAILAFLVLHALNASAGFSFMNFDEPAFRPPAPYGASASDVRLALDLLGDGAVVRVGKKVLFERLSQVDQTESGQNSPWLSIFAALAAVGWGLFLSGTGVEFPGFLKRERRKSKAEAAAEDEAPLSVSAPAPAVTGEKEGSEGPKLEAKQLDAKHVEFAPATDAKPQEAPRAGSRRPSLKQDHHYKPAGSRRPSIKSEHIAPPVDALAAGSTLTDGATAGEVIAIRSLETCLALVKAEGPHALSDDEVVLLVDHGHVKEYALEKWCQDPVRGVKIRRLLVARSIDKAHAGQQLPYHHYDYMGVVGQCCENVIGYMPIPVGVAGPYLVDGKTYQIPMATTEGALIASTSRGCKAISSCGGARTVLTADGMTRGPVIEFPSAVRAAEARKWAESESGHKQLKAAFESTTRFGKLNKLKMANAGKLLFMRFSTFTGDAMGMNMISKGCEKALDDMAAMFPDMRVVSLSGNYCTDKKPAAINWIEGRGKSVIAEATISGKVVQTVLKTSVAAIVHLNTTKNLIGSAMAGSIGGFNAHAANILTAVYLATGQDPAQNVESSQCMTLMEAVNDGQDLHISVTMPCIEVGTVGGGTTLAPQAACLDLLGVRGPNHEQPGRNSQQLARLIAAAVMAGELSLCAALAAGHLVKSHMAHNRAPPAASVPANVGGAGNAVTANSLATVVPAVKPLPAPALSTAENSKS